MCEAMEDTKEILITLHQELLPTWQPVAAIAFRCKVPVKSAIKHLNMMYDNGVALRTKCRIDGHNKVHLYKLPNYTKVMGVWTLVVESEE